tara:strand:- start:1773 stop:1967 length:195 start_codon:yes stop_codon:yes gene_type:complete
MTDDDLVSLRCEVEDIMILHKALKSHRLNKVCTDDEKERIDGFIGVFDRLMLDIAFETPAYERN